MDLLLTFVVEYQYLSLQLPLSSFYLIVVVVAVARRVASVFRYRLDCQHEEGTYSAANVTHAAVDDCDCRMSTGPSQSVIAAKILCISCRLGTVASTCCCDCVCDVHAVSGLEISIRPVSWLGRDFAVCGRLFGL